MFSFRYKCNLDKGFKRGHESCSLLPHPSRLIKAERKQKQELAKRLKDSRLVTDVDILLNNRQLDRATKVLMSAKTALGKVYRNGKLVDMAVAAAAATLTDANGDIIMLASPK
jgi:alpha-mannosidase